LGDAKAAHRSAADAECGPLDSDIWFITRERRGPGLKVGGVGLHQSRRAGERGS
jgi:hypothetical protein